MCHYKSTCLCNHEIKSLNPLAANFEIATFYNKFNSKLSIQFYKVFIKVNRSCDQVSRLSKLGRVEKEKNLLHT